jgi:hypothetical protein
MKPVVPKLRTLADEYVFRTMPCSTGIVVAVEGAYLLDVQKKI